MNNKLQNKIIIIKRELLKSYISWGFDKKNRSMFQ